MVGRVTLIVGGIAGWLAGILMSTDPRTDSIANVRLGGAGPALGLWIAGLLGIAPAGGVLRSGVAEIGAVRLIFILGTPGRFAKA